jgi:3-oxoacyl-[acyl-carrier protein] reductase
MLLKGKTSVITGCNRGIGKSMLEVFAKNGANVWAIVRKPDEEFSKFVSGLVAETGVSITPVYCDLSQADQVKEAAKTIISTKQPVDVLINNAGVIFTSLFQMTSIDKMKEMFEVNFFAPMLLSQYIVRAMSRQKSGSIVNFSSSAAIEGNEGRSGYAASKAAIIAATKVMARELAAYNIRVNAIAPGLTQTEMMTGSTPEDALADTVKRISMRRVGRPEEIANAALFLSSDLSSYMTGQVLRVDGGM